MQLDLVGLCKRVIVTAFIWANLSLFMPEAGGGISRSQKTKHHIEETWLIKKVQKRVLKCESEREVNIFAGSV